MDAILAIARSVIALIAVIWIANIALKYVNNLSNKQNRQIQIIERVSVSKNSAIAIVKIIDTYYLMSFSDQSTESLQTFTAEEAKEIEKRMEQQEENFDLDETKAKFAEFFNQRHKN